MSNDSASSTSGSSTSGSSTSGSSTSASSASDPLPSDHLPSDPLARLVAERAVGVLVTLKRDGRPQLSNVSYAYDAATTLVRVSVTDDRAKVANLRRDSRVSLYVTRPDMGAYAVVEGVAELSPVAVAVDDAVVGELVEHYRTVNGEHPDWDDFRAAMVSEKRLLVRFLVDHSYGWGGPS